jgi:hypothetical protein
MRRVRTTVAALSIFGSCLVLAGCADDGSWDAPRTPTISVAVADGCPPAVAKARDVANADPGDSSLLPAGISPDAGLVCAYSGPLNPSSNHLALTLDASKAGHIVDVLRRLSLKQPIGSVNCPADTGAFAILAFSYPHHPDVNLWWNTTGCQSIDNGRIGASQIGSPSFGEFQAAFDSAAGLPEGPVVHRTG